MAPSLKAKDVAKICHYAGVNHKLPHNELQAQWEALGDDPEALIRVSKKFAELQQEAIIDTQPIPTKLYETFYKRFIQETKANLTLLQYATIAEDARKRLPMTKYAQNNEITRLRKHQEMKATNAMTEVDVKQPIALYDDSTRTLHDDTIPLDGLRGIYNLGSTCYANSVWKMLAACDVFVSAMSNLDRSKLGKAIVPQRVSLDWHRNPEQFREFAVLLVQFYQELQDLADAKPLRPIKLMGLARNLHPGFKVDEQQDAAEFTDFLLAVLDVCLQVASGPVNPVGNISYGIMQELQCSCGYRNHRTGTDRTMKVAIDPDIVAANKGNVTLMQLIGSEFSGSPSPDGFVCDNCRRGDLATISSFVTTVPSHLLVQLKRFHHDDAGGRKVEEPVDFPMSLDILPIVHTSWRGISSTTYDCISIIEHIGDTLEVGHYITKNRRHNSTDWISHDDTKITEVPANSVVTKDAYILLYKQRTAPMSLQVLDEKPLVLDPKPPMSKVQMLKHKYEQAKRTADAGRKNPTAVQARFELNEKKAKQAYEKAALER